MWPEADRRREAAIANDRDPQDERSLHYRLTAKGVELAPTLMELGRWGTRFEEGEPPHGILQAWEEDPQECIDRTRRKALETRVGQMPAQQEGSPGKGL